MLVAANNNQTKLKEFQNLVTKMKNELVKLKINVELIKKRKHCRREERAKGKY